MIKPHTKQPKHDNKHMHHTPKSKGKQTNQTQPLTTRRNKMINKHVTTPTHINCNKAHTDNQNMANHDTHNNHSNQNANLNIRQTKINKLIHTQTKHDNKRDTTYNTHPNTKTNRQDNNYINKNKSIMNIKHPTKHNHINNTSTQNT